MLYEVAMRSNAFECDSAGIDDPVKQMLIRLEQRKNTSPPIEVTFGNDAVVRLEQSTNAALPIDVAFGKDIVVSLEQ